MQHDFGRFQRNEICCSVRGFRTHVVVPRRSTELIHFFCFFSWVSTIEMFWNFFSLLFSLHYTFELFGFLVDGFASRSLLILYATPKAFVLRGFIQGNY